MAIAYLINQYPKVSHSFIRREIRALETQGLEIHRFSIRSRADELVDPVDQEELTKTRYILNAGILTLLTSAIRVGLTKPLVFLNAIRLAIALGWNSERGVLLHVFYLVEACLLLRWFTDAEIHHAHAHFGTNAVTVLLLCEALGGPGFSFTVHGPEEFDKPRAIRLTEKIKRARFVVAISSYTQSQLYRWCDFEDWPKITVVRCGLDAALLQRSPKPISPQPRLVCVGRLCEQKGQLLLIEAAHQLTQKGIEFELILIGDGPLREAIETLIDDYQLRSRIKITGWVSGEAVIDAIESARALVLPSFAEGLPVALMECLALGRPVITTYIAGIPELIEPGKNGWLIPAGSIDRLSDALKQALAATPNDLEDMGQQGFHQVSVFHNIDTEAQKLLTLFQSCSLSNV